MGVMIAVIVLILVGGTAFTLWWWRIADRWADSEHKRFKVKQDPRERVVVKGDQAETQQNQTP